MKLLNILSWIAIVAAFIIVGVVAYWSIYPYKLLEINNSPMETNQKVYHPGDTLTYYASYCKYTTMAVTITRSFVDGIKFDMPAVTANNPSGCNDLYPTITVPNLPPGSYRIDILYTYQINPLRIINYHAETNQFIIEN